MILYLVEHFFSIQGEGRYTGVPSLFFRFGGCNMKCEGFGCIETSTDGIDVLGCDTVYAVNKEHFSDNWQQVTQISDLMMVFEEYKLPKNVDVVLTGGEPLIYANDEIFIEFLEILVQKGHRITFETNGSIDVDFDKFPVYKECIFALSIKLSNSGESLNKRVRGDVISSLAKNSKEAFFKFSIDADSINSNLDKEISDILFFSPNTLVYCMPLGGTKTEVEANTQPLIEFCKSKGYIFSDRLHIRIWDQNKGV